MPAHGIRRLALLALGVVLVLPAPLVRSTDLGADPTAGGAQPSVDPQYRAALEALLTPHIEKTNRLIRQDRGRILATRQLVLNRLALTRGQRGQYRRIAGRYREPVDVDLTLEAVDALLQKVAEVPALQLVDQAARASNEATASRSRQTFNYYGLLCRRGNCELQSAIGPRTPLSRFSSLLDATRAYARMLNTQPEFADFRERRASAAAPTRQHKRSQ